MSLVFRRALSSLPSTATTASAASAGPSTSSTLPRAVHRRRLQSPSTNPSSPLTSPQSFYLPGPGDKTPRRLPDELEDRFQALRLRGQYKGDEASGRRAFLLANAAWRSRVRGVVGVAQDAEGAQVRTTKSDFFVARGEDVKGDMNAEAEVEAAKATSIVGQRIYLPNVQIRLMRNHTPPGQAYDPWIATFRIPPSMTKTDLRSYLMAAYQLPVTFIRTDNYVGELRRVAGGEIQRTPGSRKNYKRAVVGLTEPFHYPDDVEEMRAGTFGGVEQGERLAKAREKVLDDLYFVERQTDSRKRYLMKMFKGWRWRAKTHDNEGNTVREIMRRRQERENSIAAEASRARHAAETGAEFVEPAV